MSDQQLDENDLPIEVGNDETIVRAILTPWHRKKNGEIKKQALKPKVGKSDLSVIRQEMGDDFCKCKAVQLGQKMPKDNYCGLLTIKAGDIREAGSEVTDSRDEYLGHADLDHGFPALNAGDPSSSPEDLARMDDRISALLDPKIATYHHDPEPDKPGWSGIPLKLEDR